jgi:hypothetical protein
MVIVLKEDEEQKIEKNKSQSKYETSLHSYVTPKNESNENKESNKEEEQQQIQNLIQSFKNILSGINKKNAFEVFVKEKQIENIAERTKPLFDRIKHLGSKKQIKQNTQQTSQSFDANISTQINSILHTKSENKSVRLFVSSTFKDMMNEREQLVKTVFPILSQMCEKRGLSFSVVDLKWGITEEMAKSGQVITTCLNEVDK